MILDGWSYRSKVNNNLIAQTPTPIMDRLMDTFCENEAFRWAMAPCREKGKTLHLLGIVSSYSSQGSLDHLLALMGMAKREGVKKLHIHSFLGRRGERLQAARSMWTRWRRRLANWACPLE